MQQLNSGVPRSTIAFALLSSPEYFNDIVRNFYTKYLHRVPGQPEVNGWVGALQRGLSDEAIIAGLIASPEYFNLHGGGATTQIGLDNNPQNDSGGRTVRVLSIRENPICSTN